MFYRCTNFKKDPGAWSKGEGGEGRGGKGKGQF